MRKIAAIFSQYAMDESFARMLVEELLEALPKESSEIRKKLENCLPELKANEARKEKLEAEIQEELEAREHERRYKRLTNPHYDDRDELDYRPNA